MTVTIEPVERVSVGTDVDAIRVRWSSDQPDPVFRIYQDGIEITDASGTTATEHTFTVRSGRSIQIEIVDDGSAPAAVFSGRLTLHWLDDGSASEYRIDEWTGSAWTTRGRVRTDGRGAYDWETDTLADGTVALWRVVGISASGGESVALEVSSRIVRLPDVPSLSGSYDQPSRVLSLS